MSHKLATAVLSVLIALTFVLGYTMAGSGAGWIHLLGLGLSVVLLIIIAMGQGSAFSRRPPD